MCLTKLCSFSLSWASWDLSLSLSPRGGALWPSIFSSSSLSLGGAKLMKLLSLLKLLSYPPNLSSSSSSWWLKNSKQLDASLHYARFGGLVSPNSIPAVATSFSEFLTLYIAPLSIHLLLLSSMAACSEHLPYYYFRRHNPASSALSFCPQSSRKCFQLACPNKCIIYSC